MVRIISIAAVTVAALALQADATPVKVHCASAHFTSDLQDPKVVSLPAFDTLGGTLTLTDVIVDFTWSASVEPAADNDDPLQGAVVRARMIRQFSATGPGVLVNPGENTITSGFINLDPDDGDLTVFDTSAPDGHDFGIISFTDLAAGTYTPSEDLYDDGPGTVDFTVMPVLMVNDLQFEDPPGAPDSWQLEIESPTMDVEICLEYHYVPEPATLSLLALGGLLLIRRRR